MPGADRVDLSAFAAQASRLNDSRLIDRDAVWAVKLAALQAIFRSGVAPEFAVWRSVQDASVEQFGLWCALVQRFGRQWPRWPAAFQDADTVDRVEVADEDAVMFWVWLQWLSENQLGRKSFGVPVFHDLPVGFDPGGFDAWTWRGLLASGVTIGAPPDRLNPEGQDWGLQPFHPGALQADGYRPWVQSLRAAMAEGGGIRIDHVMGLSRQWWIPQGCSAAEGAYVRFPLDDLLDILCLESRRAGAVVVGEDLGVVEPNLRQALQSRGIMGSRVLWFEDSDPASWPEASLATVSTHDLPTVAGVWTASDLSDQHRHGVHADAEDAARLKSRLSRRAGIPVEAGAAAAVTGTYRLLSRAGSRLIAVSLDDALTVQERPNLPGSVGRPNWEIALPATLEQLEADSQVASVVAAVARQAGTITRPASAGIATELQE